MRVVTNEKIVASRAKLAKRASIIGLLVLVLGFVVSLFSTLFYVSLGCLVVGFLISNVGVYNANLWLKEPRADQVLAKGLKGFSNKFTLFNYTGPVPHAIVGPPGVAVFLAKSQDGRVSAKGSRWRQPFSFRRLIGFFGNEPLGKPAKDLESAVEAAKKFIGQALPDTEVPVYGAVLFSSPKVELELQDVEVPVLTEKQLKDYMRGLPKEEVLSPEQRRILMEAFQGNYEPPPKSES